MKIDICVSKDDCHRNNNNSNMICKLPTRENRPTQLPNIPTQTGDEPINVISLLELQRNYCIQRQYIPLSVINAPEKKSNETKTVGSDSQVGH